MKRAWSARLVWFGLLLGFWYAALWRLGEPSFWYDEFFNVDLILGHGLGELLQILRFEQPYPPLYYLLLRVWTSLLGAAGYAPGLEPSTGLEFLLRFPSVIAGLLTLMLLIPLARTLRLEGGEIWLPVALALHPTLLWYARDARMYSLWLFLIVLALYALASGKDGLWLGAGSMALLTHYFSLFPLAGAALAGFLWNPRWRRRFLGLGLPFTALALWVIVALPVATGFSSFGTSVPPRLAAFLEDLGPGVLAGEDFLAPLGSTLPAGSGYVLLALSAAGLLGLTVKAPRRGGVIALAFFLGVLGVFAFWQLRPVYHVRYLIWILPLLAIGGPALASLVARKLHQRWGAPTAMLIALGCLVWGVWSTRTLLNADRTTWYPDFRSAVAQLNTQARPEDRGVAVAAHGAQVFTAYHSTVPFLAGPTVGERLRPGEAVDLIGEGPGRVWTLLYQDEVVDPGGVLIGTLEAAGGYRTSMLYSRDLRLFAYTLPTESMIEPLTPQRPLEAVFENGVALRGVADYREGRLFSVILFWEILEPQNKLLWGAVHLAPEIGVPPFTQRDEPVLNSYWPLPELPVGEILPERYELILPPELAPDTYIFYALLYDPETGVRRLTADGEEVIPLGTLVWP